MKPTGTGSFPPSADQQDDLPGHAGGRVPAHDGRGSLRARLMRGGLLLAAREGIGVAIGFVGVVLLTRQIGPAAYGLYAAATSLLSFLFTLGNWGLGVYLTRHGEEPPRRVWDQAFTIALVFGALVTVAGLAALPAVEKWSRIPDLARLSVVLLMGLPGSMLMQVPRARLERRLDFRGIAQAEVAGQVVFYGVALPMAYAGFGAWAPVAGWWGQAILVWAILYCSSGYKPRLCWDVEVAQRILGDGLSYSASNWIWSARLLVNPLIVGRISGAAGVGYVALALRIVENLSFVKTAALRMSVAGLAKVQGEPHRMVRALFEAARLQVLALGPALGIVAWVGPWAIPALLGPEWGQAMRLFPFIALAHLTEAMFGMQVSALYALRRNLQAAGFHLVNLGLLAGTAPILLRWGGLVGYGWAEVAALLSYLVLVRSATAALGPLEYRLTILWWLGFGASLFAVPVGWWAVLPLLALVAWPRSWAEVRPALIAVRRVIRTGAVIAVDEPSTARPT